MLKRFGNLLYYARWGILLIFLLWLISMSQFGLGVFNLLKNDGYANPDSESARAEQLLETRLGGSIPDVIILMRSDRLQISDPVFSQSAHVLLASLEKRVQVTSLISYYSTYSQNFLSRDKRETFAVLQLNGRDLSTKQEGYKILRRFMTSSVLQISVGGKVPVSMAIGGQIEADLHHAESVTFPLLAVLLLFVFGSPIAAGLPLLIGGIAILSGFTVLRLLTMFTDVSVFASNVVTMLGLGLAIDYSIFIVTRFREELAIDENNVSGALERTTFTAGHTVIFSALTVSTSLLGLLFFPMSFLRSIGLGAIVTVLMVMLTSLTLLPALLALLGRHINTFCWHHWVRRLSSVEKTHAWYRLSEMVMRWPIPIALAMLTILLVLGGPFLHIKFATADERMLPPGQSVRTVTERLRQDFAQQGSSRIIIAVTAPGNALSVHSLASLDSYVKAIAGLPGVVNVESLVTVNPALTLSQYQQFYAHPTLNAQLTQVARQLANGNSTKIMVALRPAEHSTEAINIINKIRTLHVSGGLIPLVAGITPGQIDLLNCLADNLPYALLTIVLSIFTLLLLMTGSLILPLKAIILNILSLSATFGGLVWIFQDGHLQNLLHFQSLGSVDAIQLVLIFAIAFGLSMDYEVFLLSRIKEHYDQLGDNRQAISSGLQSTGGLITSAALLLAIVLMAFSDAKIMLIQEVGIGLAIAVIMDATLIRMLLVPATMCLLDSLNWWAPTLPRWLWYRSDRKQVPTDNVTETVPTQVPRKRV